MLFNIEPGPLYSTSAISPVSCNAAKQAPEGAGKYGTQRSDSAQVAHGWERDLGLPEVQKINAVCGPILAKLG